MSVNKVYARAMASGRYKEKQLKEKKPERFEAVKKIYGGLKKNDKAIKDR